MNSITLARATERIELGFLTRLWLRSTARLLRAVGHRIWSVVYFATKARILIEHGPRRPARRL